MSDSVGEVTQCLKRLNSGDEDARVRLLDLLYAEMRKLAARHMGSERPGHTLQATALVHEAYLKLADCDDLQSKAHFMAVASQAMRRILVDYARARVAAKRGGPRIQVELKEDLAASVHHPEGLMTLHRALERLANWDERQCRIVEMRYFGGMTEREIAGLLHVSVRTVKREWAMAKAWLHSELAEPARSLGE